MRVSSLIAALIVTVADRAFSQNLSPEISQYAHTAWTLRDSVFRGSPQAFTQTTDGYVWIGTEFGVLRFDGVRFVPWEPPSPPGLPAGAVASLLATRDGALWIGTITGLARWKNGELRRFAEFDQTYIAALLQDRNGAVWVGTSAGLSGAGRLCIVGDHVRCEGTNGEFGRFVLSLYEDRVGSLWAGTGAGLWRWKPDRMSFHVPDLSEIHAIAEDTDGALIVAGSRTIRRFAGGKIGAPVAADDGMLKPTTLVRDSRGGVWIGTQDQGLVHIDEGRVDRFNRSDGLSGNFVSHIFEDREGTMWVSTLNGLDRFSARPVAVISSKQGLSTDSVASVLADRTGRVWFGTAGGLNRWTNGRMTAYAYASLSNEDSIGSLFEDRSGRLWVSTPDDLWYLDGDRVSKVAGVGPGYLHAITEDRSGALWISDQDRGLIRVHDTRPIERIPREALGGRRARTIVADPARDGVWIGFFEGGVAYVQDGRIREAYAVTDGIGNGAVSSLQFSHDGSLWAATEGGLSRLAPGRLATLTVSNGLPCQRVHWAIEDASQSLWLHTVCGLVRIARADVASWIADPRTSISTTVYDEADGVTNYSDIGAYGPKVTRSADGRLWFVVQGGVGVIDPKHVRSNELPPPVHVEQITADGAIYEASPLRLPPDVRDLRIDYTALSLIVPANVRFRYKLEGRDENWVEAGTRRQAFYSDLPPKQYRFRVIASNNDGVWNTDGDTVEFEILPAFYETNASRIALVILILASLWTAYTVRMQRVRANLNARFEERLGERTRIAQELHDTLLQGFVSTLMQLHLFADEVVDPHARRKLQPLLQRVTDVIEEGRRAVQGLRHHLATEDLDKALVADAEEMRGDQAVEIQLAIIGRPRPLKPLIRDELYRIGREALTNVFKHAHASAISLMIEYSPNRLVLRVRDDGDGIEPKIIESGRLGHWGIQGIRERADSVGAKLTLSSRVKGGTEVEVTVPGHIAFEDATPRARWRWLKRSRSDSEPSQPSN
jgi:ligand-binding sensor domain-containing protein/two-component sensor histidine kinase